ncbi:S1/P1 nuclease [Steroidobacter agaridevorans]|uniref:S1/P1 nuclease n=1 Tax=Steroidobacter agaridevorans TaxID=2695856 RepID=UPI001327B45F|nr:S1/P1 nuclease [Steroidobacter agaridevorans]GFE91642.1 nuclease [Steroidobacter agaridevorans]
MKPFIALLLAVALPCSTALAWSRPGHMVSAAIAYDELSAQDRRIVERVVALAEKHPDRGAFEVAIGRAKGEERGRRIFLELARWPDDTRGSIHDHPTWHYWSRPIVDKSSPPAKLPEDVPEGAAYEAFALNLSVASDPRASASERAVALAWIFHLVGDIHQPLHSVSQVSKRFPEGDRGGSLQFVLDPVAAEPVSLHWYWDDRVSRDGEPELAMERGEDLMRRVPRSQFRLQPFKSATEFSEWARESYQLATTLAYGPDLRASDSAKTAPEQPKRYLDESLQVAEQRLTLAGYRLTEVLRWAFRNER